MEPVVSSAAIKAIVTRAAGARIDLVWRLLASALALCLLGSVFNGFPLQPLDPISDLLRFLGLNPNWAVSVDGWLNDSSRRASLVVVAWTFLGLALVTHVLVDYRKTQKVEAAARNIGPHLSTGLLTDLEPEQRAAALEEYNQRKKKTTARLTAAENEFTDAGLRCAATGWIALTVAAQTHGLVWQGVCLVIVVLGVALAVGASNAATETEELTTFDCFLEMSVHLVMSIFFLVLILPLTIFSLATGF